VLLYFDTLSIANFSTTKEEKKVAQTCAALWVSLFSNFFLKNDSFLPKGA
jgi:hypothetical protein